jgi:3-oxoacyl-[acyl-carrier protein] reductase
LIASDEHRERPLEGRVALVTGSSRNLGAAAVKELARNGADVVVTTKNSADVAEGIASICRDQHGVRAIVVKIDIADAASIAEAVAEAESLMGHVDIALECAALRPHAPVMDITNDDWNSVISSNLSSAFFFAKSLIPGMMDRRWGRIIHVSGADGFSGYPNRAHNIAAKAGLHGLTKALAIEMASYGITVNSIVPGAFLTERDPRNYPGWDNEEVAKGIPVKRLGDPDKDFASMSAFLAGDYSGYITGQAMHLNGGQWMF